MNGVSLREIARAAEHRNVAAVQYHFGSREGLIKAIFTKRMQTLEVRRNELLDDLKVKGLSGDLYAITWALFWPIAEWMMKDSAGANYVRFMTAMFQTPKYHFEAMVDSRQKHGTERAFGMMETILAGTVEASVFRQRIPMVVHAGMYSLTDIDTVRQRYEAAGRKFDFERAVHALLDMLVAGFSAPVNRKSIANLREKLNVSSPERNEP